MATTNKGDAIFDPFLGTGTTAVVAKKLGRKYFGIEKDKYYFEAAHQRITKARALLNYPRILILDEATSAIDYPTERRVCENLLNDENRGLIFFVTHRLSIIKDADKIVVFNEGRIDEFGNHQELIEKKGRYFALLKQSKET